MIHLHIGRHKTGTTAIQDFLSANRAILAQHGILYPAELTGTQAHHGLVLALEERNNASRNPRGLDSVVDTRLSDYLGRLRAEAHAAPDSIISSEGLQRVDPRLVAEMFGADVKILVYLREQLDYMLSAYAQEVHNGLATRTFAEFADASHYYYGTFLDRWADVFGGARLVVRIYDRASLARGDVVADFISVVGLDTVPGLVRPEIDANPSLSALLVYTKRLLNRLLTRAEQRDWSLYGVFELLAASDSSAQRRIPVSAETRRAVHERYRRDNEYVSRRYFRSATDVFRFGPTDETDSPFADSDVAAMLAQLSVLSPPAYERLMRNAADIGFVERLPLDEQRLAQHLLRVRDLDLGSRRSLLDA